MLDLKEEILQGKVVLIDKPLNWTSFQVVNKIKWVLKKALKVKKIKVGHAGTLDPLATGLLVVCIGKFTKKISEFQHQFKEYTGTITLGHTTPSYDLETPFNENFAFDHVDEPLIEFSRQKFLGKISQLPPVFSALKKDGKPLYESARKGIEVEVQPRIIEVNEFEITQVDLPDIKFRIVCSKGTYIRSIAHDFGKVLKSGAYLSELRRTKIGELNVEQAISPEDFTLESLK